MRNVIRCLVADSGDAVVSISGRCQIGAGLKLQGRIVMEPRGKMTEEQKKRLAIKRCVVMTGAS